MRYVRIFVLNFQYVLSHRGRPLIYVFTYIFSSLLFLAFMRGVFAGRESVDGWTFASITSYYFLLIPAAGTLMTHPEFPILRDDIEKGELAGRLLKPFAYYWQRFFIEIPVRIFQSISGIGVFILLSVFYDSFLKIDLPLDKILFLMVIVIFAYMICFTLKMILAVVALWTTDIRGIRETLDTLIIIFAGYIVPVNLLPSMLEKIAYFTPFPYIIYYPVIALQGKLSVSSMQSVIYIQLLWLILLIVIFKFQWKSGVKRFTDFGQ